jgi:hypothetical protein
LSSIGQPLDGHHAGPAGNNDGHHVRMSDESTAWQQQRRAAADEHIAALERRKAAESEQAAEHVAAFVRAARERNLPTTRLRAGSLNGRTTYKTSLEGWYIKRNQTLAVGVDGKFYIMSATASLAARFTGVVVHPSDPPLIVGAGGRDGESMPIAELLALRLEAGDAWPGT